MPIYWHCIYEAYKYTDNIVCRCLTRTQKLYSVSDTTRDLKNVEYPFISNIQRSIFIWGGTTCDSLILGSELFKRLVD